MQLRPTPFCDPVIRGGTVSHEHQYSQQPSGKEGKQDGSSDEARSCASPYYASVGTLFDKCHREIVHVCPRGSLRCGRAGSLCFRSTCCTRHT